jgi:hypothetical protein
MSIKITYEVDNEFTKEELQRTAFAESYYCALLNIKSYLLNLACDESESEDHQDFCREIIAEINDMTEELPFMQL